jgi:hypothetical protein
LYANRPETTQAAVRGCKKQFVGDIEVADQHLPRILSASIVPDFARQRRRRVILAGYAVHNGLVSIKQRVLLLIAWF